MSDAAAPGLLRVGLTGAIAAGKSTVSRLLRELGATVIDADQLAREVVEPGTRALREIGERFPGVVGADGRLDRPALGARIFSRPEERLALNALIHPRIQERFAALSAEAVARGERIVIYDAPLLIENGLQARMNGGVIVVDAPRPTLVARLAERNGLTAAQAEERLAAQLPPDEKRRHARWVIDNGGTLADTRAQVERVWRELSVLSARP